MGYRVDIIIRDGITFDKIFQLKDTKYDLFKLKLLEFEELKRGKKKCGHWLLHNFASLDPETKCKDCGITVRQVKIDRGIHR